MNFSVCLVGIFFLALYDICAAKMMISLQIQDEIERVYTERKKNDRYLGHIGSLTQEERLAACNFHRPGDYLYDEENEAHMYDVIISDDAIPKEEEDVVGPSEPEETVSPRTAAKAKRPMEVDPHEETGVKSKLKQLKPEETQHEYMELKNEDEEEMEPKMIYNQDVAFRCRTKDDDQDFILSYGFAPESFFVSQPVDELDKENHRFSGRKMKLKGYMFAPPIIVRQTINQLHVKYFELRQRAEKVREESPTLLEDIEKHDDISALTYVEKHILCASIMETPPYKVPGYQYVPVDDPNYFEYVSYPVGAFNLETSEYKTFPTDFLQCRAKKKNGPLIEIIGVTRSYAEGGTVFTSTINRKSKKNYLDAELTKIAVLFNRKYAGEREIQLLSDIRAV